MLFEICIFFKMGNGVLQVAACELKDIYYRLCDLISAIRGNGIRQVAWAKKNAAASKKNKASRFLEKDSRTDAKFAILKSPSKRGF